MMNSIICFFFSIAVVVDYRLDPKASTGGFELIYRQIIPPAPAYLGLNLFLKGTQLLPKNGGGKREKSKELLKLRSEMRPIADYNSSILNGRDPNPDILTPRPFIIDLTDCINSKTDANRTPRKGNKLRALMPTKRSTTILTPKESGYLDSPRAKWSSTLSRQYSTVAQIDTSRRKSIGKSTVTSTVEQPRRHVSCGPRIMTTAAAAVVVPPPPLLSIHNPPPTPPSVIDELTLKSDNEINNNNNNNENPELTCVGSKCCTENEYSTANNLITATNSSNSSRKPSSETPRIFPNNKPKLRPLNVFNNANSNHNNINNNKCIQPNANGIINNNSNCSNNNCSKSVTSKFLSANNRDYRKYVNHLQMSKLQPKSNVNDSYCSHFFAVGLSLRAWRSKYNQMLKSQNDKVEFAQSYGPISSRKSKRLESK